KRATTDVLTGLANRAGLEDAAERLGAITRGSTERLSVLYLDLDGMKEVNDSLGHPAGDQLLRTVADRIAGTLRSSDTVARLGGDEFVVLAAGIDEDTAASTLAVKIAQAVTRPVHLDGQVIVPTISIGIAVGDLATPFDVLLKKADDQLLARKRDLYGDTGHRRA
ncbi:MAG: diguanylate cyclase, partial [Candidatus Nanopelagicales bacterium]